MSADRTDRHTFPRHRHSESEPGTPASFAYVYGGRDNRDEPNPNTVASEEPEYQLESDSTYDSNGGQPESSATAAKQGAPQEPQTPLTLRIYRTAHTSSTAKASTRAPQRPRASEPESSAPVPVAKRGGALGAPNSPYAPNLRYSLNFPYSQG